MSQAEPPKVDRSRNWLLTMNNPPVEMTLEAFVSNMRHGNAFCGIAQKEKGEKNGTEHF